MVPQAGGGWFRIVAAWSTGRGLASPRLSCAILPSPLPSRRKEIASRHPPPCPRSPSARTPPRARTANVALDARPATLPEVLGKVDPPPYVASRHRKRVLLLSPILLGYVDRPALPVRTAFLRTTASLICAGPGPKAEGRGAPDRATRPGHLVAHVPLPTPNPIGLFFFGSGAIRSLIAWKAELELPVVFLLERGELPREVRVRRQHLPESHERAHDLDVHLDRARAPQHARQHRHALLRESVRQLPSAAAPV